MNAFEAPCVFAEAMLTHCEEMEWAVVRYVREGEKEVAGGVLKAKTTTTRPSLRHDLTKLAPWLRAKNANGEAVWCRPADAAHPWLMLDDLDTATAHRLAHKYAALAVETSPGNAQAWVLADRDLTADKRTAVRRKLTTLIGADPGAISEPRWGRCPGFRSGKAGRAWTNLLADSTGKTARFDPSPYLDPALSPPAGGGVLHLPLRSPVASAGDDQSAKEFGYACNALRHGVDPDRIVKTIAQRALQRGKRRTEDEALRYARKTVEAAQAAIEWRCRRVMAPATPDHDADLGGHHG